MEVGREWIEQKEKDARHTNNLPNGATKQRTASRSKGRWKWTKHRLYPLMILFFLKKINYHDGVL